MKSSEQRMTLVRRLVPPRTLHVLIGTVDSWLKLKDPLLLRQKVPHVSCNEMACVWHHRLLLYISWLWRAGPDDREQAELEEHIEILSWVAAELRECGWGQEFAEVAREAEELKGRRDHEREVAEDQRSKYVSHILLP